MRALLPLLLALVGVALPDTASAAWCGEALPGASISPVPHWPVLTGALPNPFIAYVTNDVSVGRIATIYCSDTNCAAAPTVTSHNGQFSGFNSTAGLFPCIAVGSSQLPTVGFANPLINKYLWDTCKTTNCTTFTRWQYPPGVSLNSMTLQISPALGVPIGGIFQTLPSTHGEVGTLYCNSSACTSLSNYMSIINDVGAAWSDPVQLASVIGTDQYLFLAFIKNGNLTVVKCLDAACVGIPTRTILPFSASNNCRIAMHLSSLALPLIAFCDSDNDLRVAACTTADCTAATLSPVLVAAVGRPPASAPRYGGVQLSMVTRACSGSRPLIAFSTYETGALGTFACTDATCTAGTATPLISSGVAFAAMTVFEGGNPLAGVPMLVYSRFNGAGYALERIYCLDGTCSECSVNAPQPTVAANYANPCGVTGVTPPAYPTTTPAPVGPLGPCSVVSNCGPPPTADWPVSCCDGTWVVDANATAAQPERVIELRSNSSLYWDGDFRYKENDTCNLYVDPSLFARKRQSQEALIKVDGNAFISGPLNVVLDEAPADNAMAVVTLVQTVAPSAQISGEFLTPISVTLNFPNRNCSEGSAGQVKSADGSTLSVLVTFKSKCKGGHKGLSTGQKVAIGVTVGVVGAALIFVLVALIVIRCAPDTARSLGLATRGSKPMQVGRRGQSEW